MAVTIDAAYKKNEAHLPVYYRLVVKFNDRDASGVIDDSVEARSNDDLHWKKILTQLPFLQVSKLFMSLPPEVIIKLTRDAEKTDPHYAAADFLSYYQVVCTHNTDPDKLIKALLEFEWVELAYIQGRVSNASDAAVDINSLPKSYFNASPEGIDVRYAWSINGGKGNKEIKFIDIEQGWTLDYNAMNVETLPLTGINVNAYGEHGASVLQVVMNKEEKSGDSGIVPEAAGYVISQWRSDGTPNEADAILSAISYLHYGDILLLETQSFHHSMGSKLLPVEIHDANFQAIRLATALGIIVIEAAGNGDLYSRRGNDLDLLTINNKKIFCTGDKDFRNSGAIIVAASSGYVPHNRMPGSNFGSRVDCYASGRPHGKLNGTSGSSAVIAGAALAIQSIYEAKNGKRMGPQQMKNFFSSDLLGTPSANGHVIDKIGVMPDLKKIIAVL